MAIKPVCDAIGLDSDWQIKAITDDEILGAERCEHTVQLSGFTDETTPGLDENTEVLFLPCVITSYSIHYTKLYD